MILRMVSRGKEQRGRAACGNGSGKLLLFPSVIGIAFFVLFGAPSQVEGTVYLPEFNRTFVSLPGLFGNELSSDKNDPPVAAYLTMIPNQPYMCPDELKNIQPQPPPQFFNNEQNFIDNNMMISSNQDNANSTDAASRYFDPIETLPDPDDGLPIALLVERGMCTFWEKAELASKYGPSVRYVIIYDDVVSPDLVPMSSEYPTDMTLLFVSSASGHEMRDLIRSNQPTPHQDSGPGNAGVPPPPPITGFDTTQGSGEENQDGTAHSSNDDYGDHKDGLLVLIDGDRPYMDPAFPALNMAAYFLAAMSGFLAFLIFFGCLLVCAQCGCITAAPDEHGRIVLFAGGPGIRHTEGLARMIRVHKLTAEQVQILDEEEFLGDADACNSEEGGDSSCCCAICLDDFDDGEKVRVLPCGHKFHEPCLIPWLTERDASCPLCKMDVLKHVLEIERKKKLNNKDGGNSETGKEGRASDMEASGDETAQGIAGNHNDRNTNNPRGTSPVRSVWYRLWGWSLIADTVPSEDHNAPAGSGATQSSLEVISEIEMENRTPASSVSGGVENTI